MARFPISNVEARLAGWFYLGTIICGLFAELVVRSPMRNHDAGITAFNIAQQQGLYRSGEVADLIMLSCYIVVTALLYLLFAPANRSLSLIAAAFSMVGIATLAVAGLLHLIPLASLEGSIFANQAQIAQLALHLHGSLYGISLYFFGVYCALIGWLCLKSRLLPRAVGLLMTVGGLTHVVTKSIWILAPQTLYLVPSFLNLLPLLGEVSLAVWLVAFGPRRGQ